MENSIEEDIARIAKLITTKFNNDYSIDNKDKEAIEHILSDYKRVLKENEELEEINNELEAEKNEAIRRYNFESIPVSLVEEKIEELKEDIKKGKTRYPYILEHKIEVLQELLEREQ